MEKYLIAALVTIFVGTSANAQNQSAILGQPSQIRFAVPNVTNQDKCHIEVNLPNQQKIAIENPRVTGSIPVQATIYKA